MRLVNGSFRIHPDVKDRIVAGVITSLAFVGAMTILFYAAGVRI